MTDKDVKKTNADQKKLSENELDNVSGGLWDITIIDTCQKKYDYNHCCNNFGNCPQLDVAMDYSVVENGRKIRHIACSCKKGYFTGVSDIHKA